MAKTAPGSGHSRCSLCTDGSCGYCSAEQRRLDDLRLVLPPIIQNPDGHKWLADFHSRVAIDCEWVRETGALTLVGVGNHSQVVQLPWQSMTDAQKSSAANALCALVGCVPVVYHNADADLRVLRRHDVLLTPGMHLQLDDTMLAHGVLHSEEEHTLEYLSTDHGKLFPYKFLRWIDLSVYNECDLLETLYVWDWLVPQLAADPAAARIYRDERLALLPYIIHDEERGIGVARARVYPLYDKLSLRREQAACLAQAYAGWPINLNSPDQMKVAVYDVEGFPVQFNPKTHEPTLDKDALSTLRRMVFTEWDPDEAPTLDQAQANIDVGGHPILEARYLHFGAQQAISHYITPCFVNGSPAFGVRYRLYPETRQHVQASGRHSIVGPAMQQLKGELELLFTPDPGTVWLGFDWSNVETWLLGVLAGDPLILKAKADGWDTHVVNYCDFSGTPLPPVLTKALHTDAACLPWREAIRWQGEDDARRAFSKRFVYRIHYRGKPEGAGDIPGARSLGFDASRLVTASDLYLGKHHWIVEYWQKLEREIDTYGVVYTFAGTPRRLTSLYQNARYREGCNQPMQGGVANIYNTTRLLIHRALPWAEFMYGKHDSQWWQVPEARVEEAWAAIKPIVTREFTINGTRIGFPASFKERRPE